MRLDGAQVALTGATGFLGRALVEALLRRGARVIGTSRRPERAPQVCQREGVTMRRAELAEVASLEAAFDGADAIISNAALFALGNRSWRAHHEANVQGTRHVLEAAARAQVPRVVHVSSVAVYRDRRGVGPVAEDAAMWRAEERHAWNAYAVSKACSERAAWALAEAYELALTCVRPGPIYGPHDPNITPLLRRVLGLPLLPVPHGLCLPLVYVEDVAEAIVRALEVDPSIGRAYNAAGDGTAPMEVVAEAWAQAGGAVARPKGALPVPLTIQIDNTRASRELGWRRRPLVEGLRATFARQPELTRSLWPARRKPAP